MGTDPFGVQGHLATGIAKPLKPEENIFYYFKWKTSAVPLQEQLLVNGRPVEPWEVKP
jgi:hypothetical protein